MITEIKKLTGHSLTVVKARYFMEDEENWEDITKRQIIEISKVDSDSVFISNCKDFIGNMDFLPGGRILRNIGKVKGSLMNCNVVPIGDSIEEIANCIKNTLIIWSFGGGVGINFSTLRPKGSSLTTKGGKSSGLVSFLRAIDGLAETIESGGQRRAAGIAICDINHPEILEFINVKLKKGLLRHFNLSVAINNRFLEAIENNEKWELKFDNKIYDTVNASDLWETILQNMLENGEPGLINMDKLVDNNSEYFSPIISTNPCGEICLPAWGSCDLGSINLPHFVSGHSTNWKKLEECIKTAVRFLDNIIDINYYPIQNLEIEAKNSRRIGLGVMGLADYLIAKKIRYGSEQSLAQIERLFKFIRDKAYETSIELAKLKKPFPMFDRIKYCRSSFIRSLPAKLRMEIKEHGIRNVCLLTCAPTGTTSLIPNVSSGIEPIIFKSYERRDRINSRIYVHPLYKKFLLEGKQDNTLDYLVDTTDLKPIEHLEVQSLIQKYIDSGISKTINLPSNTGKKKLSKFLLEYIRDLKGVTVLRDLSREEQVYYRLTEEETLKYLNIGDTVQELEEEDVSCSKGVCSI